MTRRYLLIKVVSDRALSGEQFGTALTDIVRKAYGEIGLSQIDPKLIRFDTARSQAIVACRPNKVNELQAAITLLSEVSDIAVAPLVLRHSGTIKSLSRRK